MSTSLVTPSPEQIEAAVNIETNRIINESCAKHNVHPSSLSDAQREDARRTAVQHVEREVARKQNPMFAENELLRQKLESAELQIFAMKNSRANAASADNGPRQVTVAEARGKLGELEWNHRLNDQGRLQAIGIDPAKIDAAARQEIADCFGPRSSSSRASDLHKSNPQRYKMLREVGHALKLI